jgi:hypothetical protein
MLAVEPFRVGRLNFDNAIAPAARHAQHVARDL